MSKKDINLIRKERLTHNKHVSFIFMMRKGYMHCAIRYCYNYFTELKTEKTQDNCNHEYKALLYTSKS